MPTMNVNTQCIRGLSKEFVASEIIHNYVFFSRLCLMSVIFKNHFSIDYPTTKLEFWLSRKILKSCALLTIKLHMELFDFQHSIMTSWVMINSHAMFDFLSQSISYLSYGNVKLKN